MDRMRKILIADDDEDLRAALDEQFALHSEFVAIHAETGGLALSLARQQTPDLVIMDVGLPDMDGRDAVATLRKEGFKNPIIMLTGHDSDKDTIQGLESGCKSVRSPSSPAPST
jgi:DNA-binding response OmpR family regulator